jgi:hypothetical protein
MDGQTVQSMMDNWIVTLVWRGAVSVVVAGVVWWLLYPIRALKSALSMADGKLSALHATIVGDTTNHLNHIESNTAKTVTILREMQISAEMLGYMKGQHRE